MIGTDTDSILQEQENLIKRLSDRIKMQVYDEKIRVRAYEALQEILYTESLDVAKAIASTAIFNIEEFTI